MSDVNKLYNIKTLDALLLKEYGVRTHPGIESGVVSVGVAVTKLVSNNPNRLNLSFSNISTSTVYVFTDNQVSANRGFLLASGGGSLGLDWRDDLTLVSNDWYAIALSAGSNVTVLETVTL